MSHNFTTHISDEELWEYIDGGLGQQRRLQIARTLAEDPAQALRAETMRLENERLRAVGQAAIVEPVPDQMAAILHESRKRLRPQRRAQSAARRYGFTAAIITSVFTAGIVGGWLSSKLAPSADDGIDCALPNVAANNSYHTDHSDLADDLYSMQKPQIAGMAEKIFGRRSLSANP